MLTVKQSAAIAGISAGLIYLWIEQGTLPHYRFGRPGCRGTIRVAESDLRQFLDSLKQETKPKEQPPASSRSLPKSTLRHLRLR
jgi:excisionase family DNA binding protein